MLVTLVSLILFIFRQHINQLQTLPFRRRDGVPPRDGLSKTAMYPHRIGVFEIAVGEDELGPENMH